MIVFHYMLILGNIICLCVRGQLSSNYSHLPKTNPWASTNDNVFRLGVAVVACLIINSMFCKSMMLNNNGITQLYQGYSQRLPEPPRNCISPLNTPSPDYPE